MFLRFGLLAGLCLVLVLCEEEEIIKCPGGTCVKLHLCPNGELNTDGSNIIDIRFNPDNECEDYLLKCCPDPEEDEDHVDEPPSSRPIAPDSVTKPSSGHGADPAPGTVPSIPSSNQHGTEPTEGSGNTAGSKPLPGSVGNGGGGGNKGNQGVDDEQTQMVGAQMLPNNGQVSLAQVKDDNVPKPQGTGPPLPGAGSGDGLGTANKKPGGDIPPTGLDLKPTGQPIVPSGGGSGTGNIGSPSPSGGAEAKQPVQPGTGPKLPGASSPSGTGTGGAEAKQPVQPGSGPKIPGAPSPSGTGTGGAEAKQPVQPGTGPKIPGAPSPSGTGTGGAEAKQPVLPGTGPQSPGASTQPATGLGGAETKQPVQPGVGPQNPGASTQPTTRPEGPGAIGGSNAGQPKPGAPAVPGKPGGSSSSGDNKHSNVADTKHTQPAGDGTNKKGQSITTERPINVPQKCGVRNVDGVGFRITGDNDGESEYGEFPWMVAILKEEKALDQVINVYQCGGSLIHPSVVLTAAHCVQNKQPTEMKVRLGEWDTQTKNEIYDYQDRDVVEIVQHAEFYKGGLFNDVALLFLDKPAELMDTVSTICLPPADYNFDMSRCFASGWGKDVFGKQGTYQVILKKIELPIMARDNCQKALRTTRLGSRFKLHKSFICAGGEKNRDTCKGDGGSPLVCPIPGTVNQYYQAGMVAWGIGCGEDGIPGVYVNVPLFRGWIDEHLKQRNIPQSYYLPA